ncbi:MAG: CDP-diacylglycerol--glycerol-3-phosphate 3-phosphatidyltransferase [Chthoniobacterales bacterium]
MNIPNRLTLGRFILTGLFVGFLSTSTHWGDVVALVLFIVASLTDWLDGYLARKLNQTTNFGKLMDPLADKVLVASALICLITSKENHVGIPAWAVIIIITREFLITGLRQLAAGQGVILPADALGKHKTAWQLITILFFLILLAAGDCYGDESRWLLFLGQRVGPVLIGITVILTIYSGLAYLWKNRSLLR